MSEEQSYDSSSIKVLKEYVRYVHICDSKILDRGRITDMDRVLPFEGSLPLSQFIKDLQKSEYTGDISIEVFRSDRYAPEMFQIKKSIDKLTKEMVLNL